MSNLSVTKYSEFRNGEKGNGYPRTITVLVTEGEVSWNGKVPLGENVSNVNLIKSNDRSRFRFESFNFSFIV